MLRSVHQHAPIVLFSVRSRFIGDRGVNLLFGVISAENGRYAWLGKRVMDALDWRQSNAERRPLRVEKPAACKRFHTGNPDVMLFTDLVHLNTDGIHPVQILSVPVRKIILNVVCRRHQVESGVYAEQDHLRESAFRCLPRNHRIVGG